MYKQAVLKSLLKKAMKMAPPVGSEEHKQRIKELGDLYNRLAFMTDMHQPSYIVPDRLNVAEFTDDPEYTDNVLPKATVGLAPKASIYTLLHEKGHIYNKKRGIPHRGPIGTARNAVKLPYGYKIYRRDDIQTMLASERAATDYAKNVINKIEDPVVRDKAMTQLKNELDIAYKAYDNNYGRILRGGQFGSNAGKAIGGTVGAGLGGGLGYWGASKLGFGNTGRLIGTLGGAALGGYGGYKIGDKLGDASGQLYTQYMYKDDMHKVYNDIIRDHNNALAENQYVDFLKDYVYSNIKEKQK